MYRITRQVDNVQLNYNKKTIAYIVHYFLSHTRPIVSFSNDTERGMNTTMAQFCWLVSHSDYILDLSSIQNNSSFPEGYFTTFRTNALLITKK